MLHHTSTIRPGSIITVQAQPAGQRFSPHDWLKGAGDWPERSGGQTAPASLWLLTALYVLEDSFVAKGKKCVTVG